MQQLNKIEEELQQLIQQYKADLTNLQQEIDKAKADEEKAQQAVLIAKNGDDPKAYAKAVSEKQTASNIVEYYSGKIEELQSKPVVTENQYNEYTKRIKSELERLNNENRANTKELLVKLSSIQPALESNIQKGNELLAHLQLDLYKDDASVTTATGNKVRLNHLENRYNDYKLPQNIGAIINQANAMGLLK